MLRIYEGLEAALTIDQFSEGYAQVPVGLVAGPTDVMSHCPKAAFSENLKTGLRSPAGLSMPKLSISP